MQRAFTLWLTGLSGAGKSTIASVLEERLKERGLPVQILDGDIMRAGLSSDLGFSEKDRHRNVERAAFVARLLNQHRVVVIASFISPYRVARSRCRDLIGSFIEVYVRCPLSVCIARDVKGLYRRALAGEITDFTGISAPYEPPADPEITVDTDIEPPPASAARILRWLEDHQWLTREGDDNE
ncbi:MAG: adenylyl-sulfate kinase [Bacillota bacterium]